MTGDDDEEPAVTGGGGEGLAAADPLSARMLNEFIYCPRLFYYEYVDGVFAHSADTLRGAQIHRRVDGGTGKLPPASSGSGGVAPGATTTSVPEAAAPGSGGGIPADTAATASAPATPDAELAAARERGEVIHSRSAALSSERLNVNAKLDLVESRHASTADGRRSVVPVDYKKGAPRQGEDSNEIWDADKMQLGVQMLILRENGYDCAEGVIYYQETRQRVRLPWTADLAAWIERTIAQARGCAASRTIPPPLRQSPKCVRCSLAGICLPDETNLLADPAVFPSAEADPHPGIAAVPVPVPVPRAGSPADPDAVADRPAAGPSRPPSPPPGTVRPLMAARDDRRALYLNTPGLWVGLRSERLVVKEKDKVIDEVRLRDVNHLALFGNIQLSTQAVQQLCELEIPVTYFSMGGWFYGLTHGHGLKNVFTRVAQFRCAADPAASLALAKQFIHGKIRNQRTLLMRNHLEAPDIALLRLKQAARDVFTARSAGELLGMEGAAAAMYFSHFGGMIKTGGGDGGRTGWTGDEGEGGGDAGAAGGGGGGVGKGQPDASWCTFHFHGRNRRPPRDAVNALLSLAYSLLAKDCALAALAVGFDPYIGFFHQPRPGRPALALDLQEEFRPLVAESAVLTALNNRMLEPGDFVRAGEAVNLTKSGRKKFFDCYEKRMNDTLRHPVFNYQVSYRRALELQARLLAKALTGEIAGYLPLMTR